MDLSTRDLTTLEGAIAMAEDVMVAVRTAMNRDGGHDTVFFAIARRHPVTRMAEVPPRVIACAGFENMNAGEIAGTARRFARSADAIGTLLIIEAWTLNDDLIGEGEGAMQRWLESGHEIRQHPKARDSVMVLLEHVAQTAGPRMWVALFQNGALGDFVASDKAQGRMTGLLPQTSAAERPS